MVNYPINISDWREWTRRWWRAVAKIPRDQNPVLDEDGNRFMNFTQPYLDDGIVFLFGNRGGNNIRDISVSNRVAFFFPIVNYIATDSTLGGGLTGTSGASSALSLEEEAASDIASCSSNVRYSGGISEWRRRGVATPSFNVDWADPPSFGSTPVSGDLNIPCVSDGTWAFTNVLNGVAADRLSIEISSSHPDIFEDEETQTNRRAKRHQWNSTVTYNIRVQ